MSWVAERLCAFPEIEMSPRPDFRPWVWSPGQHQPTGAETPRSQRVLLRLSQAFGQLPVPVRDLARVRFVEGVTEDGGSKRIDDQKVLDWLCNAGWLETDRDCEIIRVTAAGMDTARMHPEWEWRDGA